MFAVEIHAVHGEPPLVELLIPVALPALAGDKVDEGEVATRLDQVEHALQGILPLRDHGEAVGARDEVSLGQLLPDLGVVDVALHELHLGLEAEVDDPLASHVEQRVGEVHQDHLSTRSLDVTRDELDVPRGPAPDRDPRLRRLDPRHRVLHEQIAAGQERLAEPVVPLALRLVKGADVLLGGQALLGHRGHDRDVVQEGVDGPAVGAGALEHGGVVGLGHRSDELGEVPAHAVVGVDEVRLDVREDRGVDAVGERAPEDAALLPVHVGDDLGDVLGNHGGGHPVHGVEEGCDGDGAGALRLGTLRPGAVEHLHAVHALLHDGEVLLLQVPRAAVGRELADDVPVVEVVVGLPDAGGENLDEALDKHLGVAGQQVELLEGHAAERGEDGPQRGDGTDLEGELEEDAALALDGGAIPHLLPDAGPDQGHAQDLGHQAGGARVHEVVAEEVCVLIPELGRLLGEEGSELGLVNFGEHLKVGAAPDGEELLPGEATDSRELELQDVKLRPVHVHGDDLLGPLAQVVEHVATGGGDGQDHVVLLHVHHGVIDGGILPRDVVDDLLAADGGHDEVLGVHVVHNDAEAVEEVHEHEAV
mmetsp:Transcript_3605/g.15840  ORF Transcript_3605/g.15840 Transcript_3605/m.15840 type:complete len:592 (+) Transcript_3605:444-2219(+)